MIFEPVAPNYRETSECGYGNEIIENELFEWRHDKNGARIARPITDEPAKNYISALISRDSGEIEYANGRKHSIVFQVSARQCVKTD